MSPPPLSDTGCQRRLTGLCSLAMKIKDPMCQTKTRHSQIIALKTKQANKKTPSSLEEGHATRLREQVGLEAIATEVFSTKPLFPVR